MVPSTTGSQIGGEGIHLPLHHGQSRKSLNGVDFVLLLSIGQNSAHSQTVHPKQGR